EDHHEQDHTPFRECRNRGRVDDDLLLAAHAIGRIVVCVPTVVGRPVVRAGRGHRRGRELARSVGPIAVHRYRAGEQWRANAAWITWPKQVEGDRAGWIIATSQGSHIAKRGLKHRSTTRIRLGRELERRWSHG